jgi:ADP-ribosylglycohydrolase
MPLAAQLACFTPETADVANQRQIADAALRMCGNKTTLRYTMTYNALVSALIRHGAPAAGVSAEFLRSVVDSVSSDVVGDTVAEIAQMHEVVAGAFESIDKSEPQAAAVKRFGAGCNVPGNFQSSLLSIVKQDGFAEAVRRNIRAGGCNCSRGNLIGACLGAIYGIDGIPRDWIDKSVNAERVLTDCLSKFCQ